MPSAFGINTVLGFAEEVTYGTGVSPTKFVDQVLEESFMLERPFTSKPNLRSVSQIVRVQGKTTAKGGFKAMMGFNGLERIMKHALGSNATTGAGPYTHTASLSDALPVGLTFYVSRDVGVYDPWSYLGCQISKLTIRQAVEEIAEIEVEVVAKNGVTVAESAPTYATFQQVDWTFNSAVTFSVLGFGVAVRDFEFTVENALNTDRYDIGTTTIRGLGRSGPRKISGKFSFEVEDNQLVDAYHAQVSSGTPETLTLAWSNGLASTSLRSLTVVAKVVFTKFEFNTKDAGPIIANCEFECYATASNNELTIATVNNTSTI